MIRDSDRYKGDVLVPFYMWAGGKSKMIGAYRTIWPQMADYTHYVEPFLGAGAIFGWMHSEHPQIQSVLSDVNAEVIDMLETLRTNPDLLISEAGRIRSEYFRLAPDKATRKAWYYTQRTAYWQNPTPGRLLILMRLGFNGIWQTCKASNGLFGTPAGLLNHSKESQVFDEALLRRWSNALRTASLTACSYEMAPVPTSGRSLIYLDPPYRNSYTSYGTGFSDDDQIQLAQWCRSQAEHGHTVLLANRCVDGDPFFEDLLGDIAQFHYFDVTYTAGRRLRVEGGFEAKPAREFLAVIGM